MVNYSNATPKTEERTEKHTSWYQQPISLRSRPSTKNTNIDSSDAGKTPTTTRTTQQIPPTDHRKYMFLQLPFSGITSSCKPCRRNPSGRQHRHQYDHDQHQAPHHYSARILVGQQSTKITNITGNMKPPTMLIPKNLPPSPLLRKQTRVPPQGPLSPMRQPLYAPPNLR